jgi:ribosomal subunit interface protein
MIQLSSLDFDITDAIRTEVNNLQPILDKHMHTYDDEVIHIKLSKTAPDSFLVNMHCHFMGDDIISHHESHNFHKALDLCKTHFLKQIDKRRSRLKEPRGLKNSKSKKIESNNSENEMDAINE